MNSVLEYTLIGIAGVVVVATGVIGRAIVLSNRKKDDPRNDSFEAVLEDANTTVKRASGWGFLTSGGRRKSRRRKRSRSSRRTKK